MSVLRRVECEVVKCPVQGVKTTWEREEWDWGFRDQREKWDPGLFVSQPYPLYFIRKGRKKRR